MGPSFADGRRPTAVSPFLRSSTRRDLREKEKIDAAAASPLHQSFSLLLSEPQMTPISRPTLAKASSPKSRSALLWEAEIMTRMRALPKGTVG